MVQGRKMTNYGPDEILDLITSFERSPSKLSENHKILTLDHQRKPSYGMFNPLSFMP